MRGRGGIFQWSHGAGANTSGHVSGGALVARQRGQESRFGGGGSEGSGGQVAGHPRAGFLLLNFAATHTPTHYYLPGERRDSPESQRAALRTVDAALPLLLDTLRERGPTLLIVCADHGTCHGEDGYWGHRVAHPLVWTVPYMETVLEGDI
ncbi:alkaline phosphatase family protein [Deinococcus lacus]|uniref:Alkaline phosphatase family protein n=1 Tax=Deinococcus lacus TaxID=392561 RepID=A0ABW1YFS5_9DEIO